MAPALSFTNLSFDLSQPNKVILNLTFLTYNFKITPIFNLHFYINIYDETNNSADLIIDPISIDVLSGSGLIFGTPQYDRQIVTSILDPNINYNSGIIGINELDTNTSYSMNIVYSNSNFINNNQYKATITTQPGTPHIETPLTLYCLFEDTEVLTPSGYVSVKSLQKGDLVTTSDGRDSHIKRIWSSNMPLQEQFYPIVIKANSITENYPTKDCRLSKYHLINFNGNWITPYKNEHIFKYDREVKSIKYYHLELENYLTDHLVINGGLVVESLGNGEQNNTIEWDTRVKNSIIL